MKMATDFTPSPFFTLRRRRRNTAERIHRQWGQFERIARNGKVSQHNGSSLTISKAGRLDMGAYLCIASNGIPPTVSKRVMLIVHCKYGWPEAKIIN